MIVLAQTFTDFELLLVADGSTDDSSRMCDLYSTLDSRVTIRHITNGGVSVMQETEGGWITFDYITIPVGGIKKINICTNLIPPTGLLI